MASGTDLLKQQAQAIQNSKVWQKHGKLIKDTLNDWAGPLAIAIGLSFKFLAGVKGVLVASQLVGRSLEAWSRVQYYTPGFAKLLGGMDKAKARLSDLVKMSASGPFKFDSLVQANRRMEILTRGLFSGKKAMDAVQNAAAASGTSPEMAAEAIGGAMQAISRHEGVDGALDSLGQMGIVSARSADELRNLARSGASEQQMLVSLETALGRNNGAAAALGNTIHGISQQMAGASQANLADIGSLFESGKIAGMQAGLMILKEYGPALTSLMKPVAAVYNAWNQLLLGLANVAAWEMVKNAMKSISAALGVLAAAFAIKGVQILVRDVAQLAGWLLKLAVPSARAAAGMGIMRVAAVALGRGLLAALGPIGLLALALTALAEMFQMFGSDAGGTLGKGIADSVNEIKAGNDEVAKVVAAAKSGGDIGAKGEAVSAAAEALGNARKSRKRNETRELGGGLVGAMMDVGTYAAMGAGIGSMIPGIGTAIGGAVGGVVGVGVNYKRQVDDYNAKKQSAEEEQRAQAAYDDAMKARTVSPSQYMNDPDYARAKAEGEMKLRDLEANLAEVDSQRANAAGPNGEFADTGAVKALDDQRQQITQQMKDISAGVSPEALAKAFNIRMANLGTRASVMRSIGEATGDRSKTLEADQIEAGMREEAKKKELMAAGIGADRAGKMAKAEGLAGLAETLRNNGQIFASGRASVGGAAGEAAGGISPEFRAVIEEIKKIQQDLQSGNAGAQQERVRTVMES